MNSGLYGVQDQETLIRFHAHQLQTLIGPAAMLPELRRSSSVLCTAVMLFRRFYLSNSAIDISPRKLVVACAFFASKLEEERVEISALSHATVVVQRKVKCSTLCRKELSAVSVSDIEHYECVLMEGLNYEFICHHPHALIDFLVKDVVQFLLEDKCCSFGGDLNARYVSGGVWGRESWVKEHTSELLHRAFQVCNRANIFSDTVFMFAPEHIAFAIVAIVFDSVCDDGYLGDMMQDYLVTRRPLQSEDELLAYTRTVNRIISLLLKDGSMDLRPRPDVHKIVSERAERVRNVLCLAEKLRSFNYCEDEAVQTRKRKRNRIDFTPPRVQPLGKMVKVTPTSDHH